MRRIAFTVALLALVGLPVLLSPRLSRAGGIGPSQATFVIPPSDGYGIGECLQGGGDCGRAVADGWCQANGFARATAFGPAAASAVATGSVAADSSTGTALAIQCAR
ncbi:hypothetical protein [Chelatococcus reniformis]|uniref:Uncharacterized protein n=1 Tax=Chelatococcus reniformis TaxID=1494448 RepID=A0A916UJC8_9HYPH|nr:hypothetical protein [Chelatococcus reniformis]GGC73041.1 hypothetical protein GCM10010994_34280 [Chelatococcus reniformis]